MVAPHTGPLFYRERWLQWGNGSRVVSHSTSGGANPRFDQLS